MTKSLRSASELSSAFSHEEMCNACLLGETVSHHALHKSAYRFPFSNQADYKQIRLLVIKLACCLNCSQENGYKLDRPGLLLLWLMLMRNSLL